MYNTLQLSVLHETKKSDCEMTIVKVPPQIADLRREVLAATTVVSCPVFAADTSGATPNVSISSERMFLSELAQ